MKQDKYKIVVFVAVLLICVDLNAQIAKSTCGSLLDSLAVSNPLLNQEVDISVSDIPIKELVRILGNTTGLNVSVDPQSNIKVNSNFNQVKAKDVISFLCSNYKLKLEAYGSILYLKPIVVTNNQLEINYSANDSVITYGSENIEAQQFFEELTKKTDLNFILNPSVKKTKINSFGQNLLVRNAIKQIGMSNELSIIKNNEGLYVVSPLIKGKNKEQEGTKRHKVRPLSISFENDLISIAATNTKITDILENLGGLSQYHFSYLSPVEDVVSVNLINEPPGSFLKHLFYGTKNTYKFDENRVFIGSRDLQELKTCELIRLNNRRVDSLTHVLPKELISGFSVEEFHELNSLIVWGDADRISDFKKTIQRIDLPVPVVLIDVIIVDSSKSFGVETGIEAGLGEEPTLTKGEINPGMDFTMGAASVNKFLDRVGLTNLGRVSPNFYLNLKAMESNGIIDIRSTPQLSTINGHTASLAVGQTEYYKEELSNIWGYQNPQLQTQSQYKPVEAKLEIIIKPFVTGNGHVSLDIEVEQSEFTERISESAPPGLVSREFKSKISVKNQDMILLGGLEESAKRVTSKGWPLLSRIPVLKWIFSSRSDKKEKKHLNVFIKPTVFY